MVCGHSKPVLARCLSSQGKGQFRTVPTAGDPHTYRHRAVFERVPAELGRTGSVDADTYQTWTAREKTVFLSKRSKHLIFCTVGGKTLRRALFRLLQSNCKCIS